MAIKLMGSMRTLMHYTRELGKAEQNKDKDPETYWKAKEKHAEYQEYCLRDDVEIFDAPVF